MTGIWKNTGNGWELADSQPFPEEATLQGLVAENPQLLPLAGSPRLFTLGREVRLGTGYADVLAVEASGRPVIIEVKLARNAEARRAIVSQVLAYAAFLHGYGVEALEQGPLHGSLAGYGSISEVVSVQDQEDAVDTAEFVPALQEHLDAGRFRLVLVLDAVSSELERIIAYLDSVTLQTLTIDLITINVYEVNGVQIALPQRVSPDISAAAVPAAAPVRRPAASRSVRSDGSDVFVESVANVTGEAREVFDQLIGWAEQLAQLPKVHLYTEVSPQGNFVWLRPRIEPENAYLIAVRNASGDPPQLLVVRSAFERLAPNSVPRVEQAISPVKLGKGTVVRDISEEVMAAITAAYREAVEG